MDTEKIKQPMEIFIAKDVQLSILKDVLQILKIKNKLLNVELHLLLQIIMKALSKRDIITTIPLALMITT